MGRTGGRRRIHLPIARVQRTMADLLLDTKGLNCPLPILKTKKSMKDVPLGGTIEILATDPAADADFQAFCRSTGHELIESTRDGEVLRFVIRRAK
jgi:tRNA 2-thiouridine synthesizing protein A